MNSSTVVPGGAAAATDPGLDLSLDANAQSHALPESFKRLLGHSRTLLLQGPMGPFFRRLADVLGDRGQQVWKVNFNGGDRLFFSGDRALCFREPEAQWPRWLQARLRELRIDAVVLFGQSRRVHHDAIRVARAAGVAVYVFEEGYLRPDYVTLECGGVNAASSLPRDPDFYLLREPVLPAPPRPTQQRFRQLARYAALYSAAMWLGRGRYPHHDYHRPLHPLVEALNWTRGGLRKLKYAWSERRELQRLCGPDMSRRWFLVPLQVHNDSQILFHSPFRNMEVVISTVLRSFAAHGPAGMQLVFKHHPMDRAYCDFSRFIADEARSLGVQDRVSYVHDLHMPTLLKHARGVVTVNSTAGLQALHHGTPVHTLGNCLYDIVGLVHQGELADFWRQPGTVNPLLFWRFRAHLLQQTQLNASFYGNAPGFDTIAEQGAPAPSVSVHGSSYAALMPSPGTHANCPESSSLASLQMLGSGSGAAHCVAARARFAPDAAPCTGEGRDQARQSVLAHRAAGHRGCSSRCMAGG